MVLVELASDTNDLQTAYDEIVTNQRTLIRATDAMPASVVILVSPDVDSLCTARILRRMLDSDNIACTQTCVNDNESLVTTAQLHLKNENLITIFLINCGGSLDLLDALGLQSRVTVYVVDHHRPYHLSNVHSEQVRVLSDGIDAMVYPKWEGGDEEDEDDDLDAIGPGRGGDDADMEGRDEDDDGDFWNDSDDDDDGEDIEDDDDEKSEASRAEGEAVRADGSERLDADGSPSSKRRKRSEDKAAAKARRAAKKLRKEQRLAQRDQQKVQRVTARQDERRARTLARNQALTTYNQALRRYYDGTSWGPASTVILYELAKSKGQVGNDERWCILGVASMFVAERMEAARYKALVSGYLTEHVAIHNQTRISQAQALSARLLATGSTASTAAVTTPLGAIEALEDYRLPLLRSWSLHSALEHSAYTASRMRTWTQDGKERIARLLVQSGIPNQEAALSFNLMSARSHADFKNLLPETGKAARYNLGDLKFPSFIRQISSTIDVSACDLVHALSALLELPPHGANTRGALQQPFNFLRGYEKAWDCLELNNVKAFALVHEGIESARHLQQVIFRQASLILTDDNAVHTKQTFRYVKLKQNVDSVFLSNPQALQKLGFFLLESCAQRGEPHTPFVLCAPIPDRGANLVVAATGTVTTQGVGLKSQFGKKFRHAATPPMSRDEEDEIDDEHEDERRQRLIERGNMKLMLLRVKQEAFDQAIAEVQNVDLQLFLARI